MTDDIRLEEAFFYILHQPREGVIQMKTLQLGEGIGALGGFDAAAVAELFADQRADAGEGHVQGLGDGHGFLTYRGIKSFFGNRQRVLLVLGVGDEIGAAGQNLPHRAGLKGDVLDAVQDRALRRTENDIAVLSHDFYDQKLPAQITQLV